MEWFQSGHVAIVTGGSRGLGKALARELLAKGLRVVTDGRDPAELERARRELAESGDVVAIAGDVADSDHAHALIAAAERYGRLDLLVNHASTLGRTPLPAIDGLDRRTFDALFAVNVFAPIHLAQHALKLMARSELSTIVNVTSDAGVEAYPTAELEGRATRVLVFDPGDMNTAMHRAAIPEADPAELRDPSDSARALLRAIAEMEGGYARVRASDLVHA
jgi:NAD(P)-dependent dehydrogenase (short-subunit alcohol dehydrogenase family)